MSSKARIRPPAAIRPTSGTQATSSSWSPGDADFLVAAEAAQQVGSGRVEQVVAVQARKTQVVHRGQACRRAADLGQRDGAVERDDRRRRQRVQLVVERRDGAPVGAVKGGGEGVDRVDGGLELVRARLTALDARTDDRLAFCDQPPVPEPTAQARQCSRSGDRSVLPLLNHGDFLLLLGPAAEEQCGCDRAD
jgi:hypothetical protein